MNLDYAIEKYESTLAYCKLSHDSNEPFNLRKIEEYKQLIDWLKDYKRLLEAEKNWRKSLEAEIAKKDEELEARLRNNEKDNF